MRSSLKSYRKVSLESELAIASPHRIIQLMLAGTLERLAQCKYAIQNNDFEQKGILIGKSIGLINGLNNSLDMDQGGDISVNLSRLYDFMLLRLSQANIENDPQAIDDVSDIIKTIKEGWDAIPKEQHHLSASN